MPRIVLALIAVACIQQAVTRPVKKTLNFNMFLLRSRPETTDRVLLTTDGVSRFGPLLEYLVQRFQGLMSVRIPPDQVNGYSAPDTTGVPIADTAENEVDAVPESRTPGVVVRPSRTKPGTFEVEINVVVDDGTPEEKH